MFADDNWGNIRRLPTEEESERTGGIGVSNDADDPFTAQADMCPSYTTTWHMSVVQRATNG